MEFLNFGNDEKSTLCGREFHTFITLSVKKFLMLLIHCLVVTEWTMELISSTPSPAKMDKTAI